MTTSTAIRPGHAGELHFLRNLGGPAKEYAKPGVDGKPETYVLEGYPIFRSGTFRDSMGEENTWEVTHLTQMVDHFSILSTRGIFADVPVRKYHPDRGGIFGGETRNRMDELVGYITGVRTELRKNPTDDQEYTYFLADLEIIEEQAIKHVKSGLWRNVSAEIGPYFTNNNAEYWPCITGVAFVDTPAVEGLKLHAKADRSFSLILEDGMTGSSLPNNPNPPAPGTEQPKVTSFSLFGNSVSDHAAVQAHITKIESENKELTEFRAAAEESGRENYVDSLIRDNKIVATQRDGYVGYAKSLDANAFNGWKLLMDASPAMSITGAQGAGFSQASQSGTGEEDPKAQRINDLKGMISTHSLNNMPHERIKELGSYKELIGLDPSFTL